MIGIIWIFSYILNYICNTRRDKGQVGFFSCFCSQTWLDPWLRALAGLHTNYKMLSQTKRQHNTTPQPCSWVGHKNDYAQSPHPPQKLNGGLQEPQINIYWPQLNTMWPVTTSRATTIITTILTTTTTTTATVASRSDNYEFIDHN